MFIKNRLANERFILPVSKTPTLPMPAIKIFLKAAGIPADSIAHFPEKSAPRLIACCRRFQLAPPLIVVAIAFLLLLLLLLV